jgi:hypothetical protein
LIATIVRLEEKDRLLVLLNLMQRGVHVNVSTDEVMPVRDTTTERRGNAVVQSPGP